MSARIAVGLFVLVFAAAPVFANDYAGSNNGILNWTDGMTVPSAASSYDNINFGNLGQISVSGSVLFGKTTERLYPLGAPYPDATAFINGNPFDPVTGNPGAPSNGQLSLANGSTFTVRNVNVSVANYVGCTVNIPSSAALVLGNNADSEVYAAGHTASISNNATWNQGGKVQLSVFAPPQSQASNSAMISTYGPYNLLGTGATIERAGTGNYFANQPMTQFVVATNIDQSGQPIPGQIGSLTGSKLTYLNSTGVSHSEIDTMRLINYGTIRPGTNGLGTMELVNTDALFGSAGGGGALEITLAGLATGEYGALKLSGVGGNLDLHSAKTRLVIDLQSFTPKAGDHWTILQYNSLTLGRGFDTVPAGYAMTYYSDHAVLSVVPEPLTLTLLGIGGIGLLKRRRAH